MGVATARLGTVLEKARISRSAKQARANLARLKAEIDAMKARHEPAEKINGFESDGRLAIQRALREASAKERAQLSAELEGERQRWQRAYEKDFALRDFKLRNSERRLWAMSDRDVENMALRVMGGGLSFDDPAEVDILLAEARERGAMISVKDDAGKEAMVLLADELAKRVEKTGLRRPWERSDIGADLVRQIKLTDSVSGAGIMAQDEKGRPFAVSLDNLWEMEAEKEEAEHE